MRMKKADMESHDMNILKEEWHNIYTRIQVLDWVCDIEKTVKTVRSLVDLLTQPRFNQFMSFPHVREDVGRLIVISMFDLENIWESGDNDALYKDLLEIKLKYKL